MTAELSCYKLGRITSNDADGYHRGQLSGGHAKCRCPLRRDSTGSPSTGPRSSAPDPAPSAVCKKSITVPPSVNAKTAQKHDYPSQAHRRSYARRTAVERSNSRVKTRPPSTSQKGWCRIMGLVPISLFLACALVVRNLAISDAFHRARTRRAEAKSRPARARTRRRRRRSLSDLAGMTGSACP